MKPFTRTQIMYILIALLGIAVLLEGILYVKQRGALNTLISEEIRENNLNTELTNGQKGELGSLKPQIVTVNEQKRTLNVPEPLSVSVYADTLDKPADITFAKDGHLFVSDIDTNRVLVVDRRGNNEEKTHVIDRDLNDPYGIDWYEGDLYVALENQVLVYRDVATDGSYEAKKTLVEDLPTGGEHRTRTVRIGSDRKLYLSIGSSCNACEEDIERRAALVQYNLDGSGETLFAQGLRNTKGFEIVRRGDEKTIWGLDLGRTDLGNKIPPEEINRIEEGSHYGWPYCYGDGVADPQFPERTGFCENKTENPEYKLPAHANPWGMALSTDVKDFAFPQALDSSMFIAYHGSQERTVPIGYKVARLDLTNPEANPVTFLSGWLTEKGHVWGRPAELEFGSSGNLYLSDTKAGVIYQISPSE